MKTNFLNKLKQGLFLLIAILGTFVGFSQSTQNPTIGGKNTPGDIGGLLDIGGGKSSDGGLGVGQILPIVQLTDKTQCIFAYLGDTGGGSKGTSTDTGQMDGDDLDIGGRGTNTGTGQFYPIARDTGGRGGQGTSTGGDLDLPDDYDDYDTGGRGASTNTGEYALTDIGGKSTGGDATNPDTGGKNSTGGMEMYCPLCPDTGGGNGGKSITGEFAFFDTGGRDSGGGLNPLNDIGGRGGTDTGPGQFTIYDIGGRSTSSTGEVADTGGRGSELGGGCIFENGCMVYTPE